MLTIPRLSIVVGAMEKSHQAASWILRGITSNERYVVRGEKIALVRMQEGLGREESTRAALMPIRKNADWWALTQDERRDGRGQLES